MESNYKKILFIVGFLIFGAISCWATTESIHLLLPSWPKVFCWAMAIGFFVIASLGTKMIVDSLNQNIYMERRGTNLVLGVILVIVFWLFISMPTNVHSFYYWSNAGTMFTNDIGTTQGYLAQIRDNTVTEKKIKDRVSSFKSEVEIKLGQLENEIKNEANPGNGPKAKEILGDFASMLEVPTVKPLSYVGKSKQDREALCRQYRQMIYRLRDARIKGIIDEMTPPNDKYRKVAKKDYDNLNLVKQYIDEEKLDVNDAKDIKTICDKIDAGYNTVKTYSQYVNFKSNEDRAAYTAPNPKTKVSRLLSVYDVWTDFLKGKEGGMSFVFWIIVSVLIDVAAFVFFDLAFKKTEY